MAHFGHPECYTVCYSSNQHALYHRNRHRDRGRDRHCHTLGDMLLALTVLARPCCALFCARRFLTDIRRHGAFSARGTQRRASALQPRAPGEQVGHFVEGILVQMAESISKVATDMEGPLKSLSDTLTKAMSQLEG